MNKKLASLDRFHGTIALQLVMMALYWTSWLVSLITDLAGSASPSPSRRASSSSPPSGASATSPPATQGPRKPEKEFSVSPSFPLGEVKLISKAFSGVQPGTLLDKVQAASDTLVRSSVRILRSTTSSAPSLRM